MRKRLAVTVLYAVISGVWIYASHKEVGAFHTGAAAIGVLVLGVAVGAYVRSWWMLLSLVGPLIALGYLEVNGIVGTSDDWASEPLLSPPGVFVFFAITMILMIGRALGEGTEWVAGVWRRKDRDEESSAGSSHFGLTFSRTTHAPMSSAPLRTTDLLESPSLDEEERDLSPPGEANRLIDCRHGPPRLWDRLGRDQEARKSYRHLC